MGRWRMSVVVRGPLRLYRRLVDGRGRSSLRQGHRLGEHPRLDDEVARSGRVSSEGRG